MSKIVKFAEAEVAEPTDFDRIGAYGRDGDAALAEAALGYPHHWSGYTISQVSAVEIRVNPGHLFVGDVLYTGDLTYSRGLADHLKGTRLLIVSNTRPRGETIPHHMSTDLSARLISDVKPELAVLTHFGLKLVNMGPEKEVEWLRSETGVTTIAARDGLTLSLGDKIREK